MQAAESYPATTEFAYRVFYYFDVFTLALCEKWGQNNIDFTFYFEVVVVGQNRVPSLFCHCSISFVTFACLHMLLCSFGVEHGFDLSCHNYIGKVIVDAQAISFVSFSVQVLCRTQCYIMI